jgi:hypothetical protein
MKNLKRLALLAVVLAAAVACDDKPEMPPMWYGGDMAMVEQVGDTFLPRIGFMTGGREALATGSIEHDGVAMTGTRIGNIWQVSSESHAVSDITALNGSYTLSFTGANGTESGEMALTTFAFPEGMSLGEVTATDFKYDGDGALSATFNKVEGAEYYGFYGRFKSDAAMVNASYGSYLADQMLSITKAGTGDTQEIKTVLYAVGYELEMYPCALRLSSSNGHYLVRLGTEPITIPAAQ